MKKPALDDMSPDFGRHVRAWLEIVCGRRGNKLNTLFLKLRASAGANPTQAEFNALAADVVESRKRLNELLARLDE